MCGMTRAVDVDLAVDLGVHALGFVLWSKSPRATSVAGAARLIGALPPFVTPVGVFVSPSSDEVARAAEAGIRMAQIHGEIPRWAGGVAPVPVLRAVHLAAGHGAKCEPAAPPGEAVILDANDPARHGGTGTTIDWAKAAIVAATRRVVLAGGLTPANVEDAIRTVRPYGVDVASGVEERPGIKDHALMRRFVEAVGRAGAAGGAGRIRGEAGE